jgi:phenazine biosynthesis protein phzE
VAETHTKAAGILAALGAATRPVPTAAPPVAGEAELRSLAGRNVELARFWLDSREPGALTVPALAGQTAVIVDGEDTFTAMLAHQLKAIGLSVSVVPWSSPSVPPADLLIVGPGPGDPEDADDPKMSVMREVVAARLTAGLPLFAVCLGQELLAGRLGLPLIRRDAPYQGLARDVDLFGTVRRVGFYSSFAAAAPAGPAVIDSAYGRVEIARDPVDGAVHALRGPSFAGVQFHPESVLSRDGIDILRDLLPPLLANVVSPLANG